MRGGARAGRGSRVCAGRVPECRARTLAPAVVEGRRHRDHRDSCQERQQQRGPLEGQAPGHPACGRRASSPRGCRRWRREHRIARRGPARILSRCGISSPDASRVNPVSNAASPGSEPASRSVIESRACCSRALRLIAGPSGAWPCPDPQKRQEETGEAWLRHLSCVQWSAKRTRWRCSWRGSYRCPSSRNGCRHRERDTRAGTIELAIPKLRAGSYFPSFASTAAGPSGRWPRSRRPATCWAP